MWTSDERKMHQNFQEALADLVDEYLKLGMDVDMMKDIMRAEIAADLNVRQEELE